MFLVAILRMWLYKHSIYSEEEINVLDVISPKNATCILEEGIRKWLIENSDLIFTLASTFWIGCITFRTENFNNWFAVFVMRGIFSQMWDYNFLSEVKHAEQVVW